MKVRIFITVIIGVFAGTKAITQTLVNDYENPIYTALPFLRLIPDTKVSGMGDAGLATFNTNAVFLNGSANVFSVDTSGVALNYKSSGSRLLSLSGFHHLGIKNVITAGLRYNDLGNSSYSTANGLQTVGSYEYTLDVHYSRKLSDRIASGITLKYIYSKIAEGMIVNGLEMSPASVLAADLSMFYKNDITLNQKPTVFTCGMVLANLGDKITYTSSLYEQYIPSDLGIGIALNTQLNEINGLELALDIHKLLVPTIRYSDQTVLEGALASFNDAPGGLTEELKEITISAGLQYIYNQLIFIRCGYFYENPVKGPRKFFTAGAGIQYRDIQFDVAYRFFNNTQQLVAEKVLSMTLSVALN